MTRLERNTKKKLKTFQKDNNTKSDQTNKIYSPELVRFKLSPLTSKKTRYYFTSKDIWLFQATVYCQKLEKVQASGDTDASI